MENQVAKSHLTLGSLEGQTQGHSHFKGLYLVKERNQMLLLNTFKISNRLNPIAPLEITLSDLQSHSHFEAYVS